MCGLQRSAVLSIPSVSESSNEMAATESFCVHEDGSSGGVFRTPTVIRVRVIPIAVSMRSLSDSMSIVRVGFLDEARMVEPCSVVVIVGDAILSFSFLDGYVSDFSGVPNLSLIHI